MAGRVCAAAADAGMTVLCRRRSIRCEPREGWYVLAGARLGVVMCCEC